MIIKESQDISSRIASLHYEYYDDKQELKEELLSNKDQIQCVVTSETIDGLDCVDFGQAQVPALNQYADGVDTMQFLTGLND